MIYIIGAGPAGASLAYFLKDEFDTKVYERGKNVGIKPCAWSIPKDLKN